MTIRISMSILRQNSSVYLTQLYSFPDKVVHPADVEHLNVNESLYLPKRIMQYKVILTPTLSPEVDLSFSRNFCDVVLITGIKSAIMVEII